MGNEMTISTFSVQFFGFRSVAGHLKILLGQNSTQTGTAVQWLVEAPTLAKGGGRVRGRSDI